MNPETWIKSSVRNPVLVVLGTLLLLGLGAFAMLRVPVDAIPDLSDVQVIIYTEWPGRSPDLVEDQVTYPISTRLIGAPRVRWVRGESTFGKSFVYVIFEDGTDLYWARSRVLEYLAGLLGNLPPGVQPRLGPDATSVGWVFEYALVDETGRHTLAELRSFQDWTLRFALNSVPGVAEVASVGGYVIEYQVQLDPKKLSVYGVSLLEVVEAIQNGNRDVGGGTFEVNTTEQILRGRGYFRSLRDMGKTVVKVTPNGVPVRVEDLGYLTLGPAPRRGAAELDGKGECVGGIIIMRQGENALRVIDGVRKKIRELEPSFPSGVKLVPVYDRSELIQRAIHTLSRKLVEESVIVVGVCALFLWHFRSALVVILFLPAAIVLSFLPFSFFDLNANIMSLGGIAIAIGAMVDAGIVMVEAAHKEIEREAEGTGGLTEAKRKEAILIAAQRVGRPLFFSLLVLTVSFLPILGLEAQEGRLFRPLALTKTFSMLFASLLSVTLVPVLMQALIRGRIRPETQNPISTVSQRLYLPIVRWVLAHPWATLGMAASILASAYFPITHLGAEFMPPLDEGTLLYMPTGIPGIALPEATRILQIQDEILRTFPEVDHVFGKVGAAETSTDPAPLSMVETLVSLKPKSQWRPGMTWNKLLAEMDQRLRFPGMANIFWMPIQTRLQMLTTGMRSVLGIKIFGDDWRVLDRLGTEIEQTLSAFPKTRSVYSERLSGGRFLDVELDRDALARFGLSVEDVQKTLEYAFGGNPVTTMVLGRERYPVTVRVVRSFRDYPERIGELWIPTRQPKPLLPPKNGMEGQEEGAQGGGWTNRVNLSLLARLKFRSGPPSLRSENGKLVNFVFVDTEDPDLVGYVQKASQRIAQTVSFPPGYYVQWSGNFEYYQRAKERLSLLIPIVIFVIFFLLYTNTGSLVESGLVLLAVPFSLVGAFWLLFFLHFNLSVAVAVGLIALAGLDAETGVVMLLYLEEAYRMRIQKGLMRCSDDLREAILEGAAGRLRPKLMTVCTILFGLLPILWETQTGGDVMKRVAAPMVGGVLTSAVLELLVYPVLYWIWRRPSVRSRTPSALVVAPVRASRQGET